MAVFTAILRSEQLLHDQIKAVMRRYDLTFARYEVLTWLATDPESSVTLSWISRTLRIPPATVTNIIDRLEADELIRRVPHPTDARTTIAVITPEGRALATDATRDLNAEVYERIGLSAAKRNQLRRAARRAAGPAATSSTSSAPTRSSPTSSPATPRHRDVA